jgi:pyruvate dehydrogenase E2 component (dihydrolipoamide acetyltransferase)
MPQLGESVTEGTVTRWLKAVGDTVTADEPLLEVSTDKVDTEIPSPVSGVLTEIVAGEDSVVLVGGSFLKLLGPAFLRQRKLLRQQHRFKLQQKFLRQKFQSKEMNQLL